MRSERRFDIADIAVLLGVLLVVGVNVAIDWRLGVGLLGVILVAFGIGAERMRGRR